MKAPRFWFTDGPLASALEPLGKIYGRIVSIRARRTGAVAGVPVLCIGNPTLGGSGKTPTVCALAEMLRDELGCRPHIITRGYGGRISGSVRVDPSRHDATHVGDEALLLERVAPVWVGPDRVTSARNAVADKADVLIMDDGFQNPSLVKTASWLVVDGPAGIGNGRVFPAGPLRECYKDALERAQALVIIGADQQNLGARGGLPVLQGDLCHPQALIEELGDRQVFAFAGIGRPDKFFSSLQEAGVRVVATRSFPDHHRFTAEQIGDLRACALRTKAELVTTEKDIVRLGASEKAGIRPIPVTLKWRNHALVRNLLEGLVTPVSTR